MRCFFQMTYASLIVARSVHFELLDLQYVQFMIERCLELEMKTSFNCYSIIFFTPVVLKLQLQSSCTGYINPICQNGDGVKLNIDDTFDDGPTRDVAQVRAVIVDDKLSQTYLELLDLHDYPMRTYHDIQAELVPALYRKLPE